MEAKMNGITIDLRVVGHVRYYISGANANPENAKQIAAKLIDDLPLFCLDDADAEIYSVSDSDGNTTYFM